MKIVTVMYGNGNIITTKINASNREILRYFEIGDVRNIGSVNDDMQIIINVDIKEE